MEELKLREKAERLDNFIDGVMNIASFVFDEDVSASCCAVEGKGRKDRICG